MNRPEYKPQDLSALINQAQTQINQKENAHRRQTEPRGSWLGSKLVQGLFALAIAYSGYWGWSALGPPRQSQVARDLELTVDQARASVEIFKSANGVLPETLPHAALAAVVRYERGEGNYKLVASMMGLRVTLEPDGRKSTETGVR